MFIIFSLYTYEMKVIYHTLLICRITIFPCKPKQQSWFSIATSYFLKNLLENHTFLIQEPFWKLEIIALNSLKILFPGHCWNLDTVCEAAFLLSMMLHHIKSCRSLVRKKIRLYFFAKKLTVPHTVIIVFIKFQIRTANT